jgi:hypothetical protein
MMEVVMFAIVGLDIMTGTWGLLYDEDRAMMIMTGGERLVSPTE